MRGKELDTLIELINIYLRPPLQSPLSQRASSTVMLCLVHCTSLMPHFCYLQKFSSLLYNIIFCQHILHLKMF